MARPLSWGSSIALGAWALALALWQWSAAGILAQGTDTWSQLAPAPGGPTARGSHVAVWDSASGRMLVFGGWDLGGNRLNDLWAYAPATNSWAQLQPAGTLPDVRVKPSALWDPGNRQMLLFGGATPNGPSSELWAFRPSANAWAQLSPGAPVPPAREAHSAVWDEGRSRMLVFGGWTGRAPLDDLWSYDPTANRWAQLAPEGPLPPARGWGAAAWDPVNDQLLIFGGSNNVNLMNDLWAYRPATNAWAQLAQGPMQPHDWPTAVWDSVNSRVLVYGGHDGTTELVDVWSYRPAANAWTRLSPSGGPPPRRYAHTTVWEPAGSQALVFAGVFGPFFGQEGFRNDLWSFRVAAGAISATPTATATPTTATGPPTATPTRSPTPTLVATATAIPPASATPAGAPTSGGISDPTLIVTPVTLPLQPVGAPFVDPPFRTTLRRVSNLSDRGGQGETGIYSQLQAFSSDNAYVLLQGPNGFVVRRTGDFSPVSLNTSEWNVPRWHPAQPHVIVHFDTNADRDVTLQFTNVDTGTTTDVFTFPPQYVAVFNNESFDEISDDGRWVVGMVRRDDGQPAFFTLDIQNRQLGVLRLLADFYSSGECLPHPEFGQIGPDWTAPSPLGRYLVVQWRRDGTARCSGLETFDIRTGAFTGRVYDGHQHSDLGVLPDGTEFLMVFEFFHPSGNLSIGLRRLPGTATVSQPEYLLVLPWAAGGDHISCRGPRGLCVVSGSGQTDGVWYPFEDEIYILRTDGSVSRLAHHRSTRCGYWSQPRASVSRDGRYVIFASDWGRGNPAGCGDGQADAYIIDLGTTSAVPSTTTPTSSIPSPSTPTPTPPAARTATPTPTSLPTTILPIAGRDFAVTSLGGGLVQLTWRGGSGVVRITRFSASGAAAVPVAPSTTIAVDSLSTEAFACYFLEALEGGTVRLASELLCVIPRLASPTGAPRNIGVRLSRSIATLTWVPPAGASVQLLLPLNTSRVQTLGPTVGTAPDNTGGAPTCYVVAALMGQAFTISDGVCAIPGPGFG